MVINPNKPLHNTLFFLVLFFSCFHQIDCLATVSISPTSDTQQHVICALTQQFYLNCTTFPGAAQIQIPSKTTHNSTYSAIVGGKGFVCALRSPSNPSISVMGCWRFSGNGNGNSNAAPPRFKRIYHGSALSELKAGDSHVCGLVKETNRVKCWQWARFSSDFAWLETRNFSAVSVGDDFLCGLNMSRNIICKGRNTNVNRQKPTGTYRAIEAGDSFACVLTSDDRLSCWGDIVAEAPKGKFTSLALGQKRGCAIRDNGTVTCWGEDNFSIPANLEGNPFVAVEAKGSVFCGILSSNFSLVCWGSKILGNGSLVSNNVLPGACSSSCQCGPLPRAPFCGAQYICWTCPSGTPAPAPETSPAPSPSPLPTTRRAAHWSAKMIAALVVGIVGCASLAATMVFWFLVLCQGKGRSSRVHDSGRLDEEDGNLQSNNHSLERSGDPQPQRQPPPVLETRLSHIVSMGSIEEFPLEVLLQATNNFSQDHRIGNGSYGSVYKAELLDGRRVAVKRAEASASPSNVGGTSKRNEERDNAFLAELGFLSKLNHKNLVRLLGFYEDSKERVLVYEYMINGTLHDHLHRLRNTSSPLATWPGRLKVALDAARGIEYLHVYAVPPVIHRDIKPSNILLDENWTAKVSDFGLSLMGPSDEETHLSLLAAGTLGYVDPEYYRRHQLTSKSDVYSLGVVLLELLTGNKAIHLNENGLPRNVVEFVIPYINRDEIHRVLDPNMPPPTPIEIEAVANVGYLAADCVSLESRDRPSMTEIVSSLEKAWRLASLAPATTFLSSTNSSHSEN